MVDYLKKEIENMRNSYGTTGYAEGLLMAAREYEEDSLVSAAATVYDRVYGLAHHEKNEKLLKEITPIRQNLLDRLSVVEHGIMFRYIPAGTFLMGSEHGDPDEQPVHPVRLRHFWISETPISWATYCDLMSWQPPPEAMPPEAKTAPDRRYFSLYNENKIRLQYCEDQTIQAHDWHAHAPEHKWVSQGKPVSSRELFGEPARENPARPWRYDTKPMVSVTWQMADDLCQTLSHEKVHYRLPTEAQWEKAARGGLINCPYPWGDKPPTDKLCDFDHFGDFKIKPMKTYPPNGYGLHAMSGGVWEWTQDWYDAQYYKNSPRKNPTSPEESQEKVLRGGSWSDCAEAVTVTFRMSIKPDKGGTPNFGFRLCRIPQKPAK